MSALSKIFGGQTKTKKKNMQTEQQQQLLAERSELARTSDRQAMSGLTDTSNYLGNYQGQSAYNALPNFEQSFNDIYANPMNRQFQNTMSNLQHSGERNSSGARMRDMAASQQHIQNLFQARGQMMMTERDKQQQAQEQAYARELQARQAALGGYNSMLNLGNSVLGTRTNELYQKQGNPGALSYINSSATTLNNLKNLGR
jgi:hypothetical protein